MGNSQKNNRWIIGAGLAARDTVNFCTLFAGSIMNYNPELLNIEQGSPVSLMRCVWCNLVFRSIKSYCVFHHSILEPIGLFQALRPWKRDF